MTFIEAVKSALSQYAVFGGRARRSAFWWFVLFTFLVQLPFYAVDAALDSPVAGFLVAVALALPSLSVGARRLHDTGRSGWWQLLSLVPLVGIIVLIVWWAGDSHPDNQHGPNPKHGDGIVGPAA